jgi:hypothetical protein
MSTRTRYTVVFTSPQRALDRVCRVLADDPTDARARAVRKIYGSKACWLADSGLLGYGQVFEPAPGGGYSAVTYRIGCDITTGW